MPVKNSLDKKITSGLSGNGGDTFSFLFRPAILGVITFCLLAFLFSLLIYQRYALLKEAKIKEGYEIVNQAKDKLQETLTHGLSATKTLAFFVDHNGQVKDFNSIAAQILETTSDIDAIQLVPGGVIRYVYPLKGNEKVVGYDVLKDSTRNKEAYKAIEKKQMFFAGPFELRQGGMGVVGRLPVYRNNKFWGFSAVVLRMSTLFKAAGIDSTGSSGSYFQLSKINPDTKAEEYFLPLHKDQAKSQTVSVRVPNGEWKLSVIRLEQSGGFDDIALLALLGFLLSLSGAVLVYRIAIRPLMLDRLVKEQTIDLKRSENKYRSVIERVSDAFVAIDKDWVYTYVNERAGEIFARDPQSLVGKNIWVEFPEGIDKPFYHAYYRAMETQEYQYLEEYYSPYDKWFENHIYPSKDGLTIFFEDITEIKKISLALKENEEKYRSLIEQASDGIVLSDLDGYILEVNNSISHMSGYSVEEMEGKHLYDFLPEEDATLNPLRFKELMEGKSLLYERRLLKKDGTTLDIEVNSKMATSQMMIGFIRDITERKRNEDILRYQARLLESVSDAITSLDMNRCIASWNRACEDLYGFTTEEVMGKRIPELVTFEFPGTIQEEVFKQVFSEGKWRGEFNFIHPKTRIKTHLLSSINLLRNMEGEISGFIITSKDISDLKQAADKLQKREVQLSASIENTPNIAVQWYNDKGEVLYWNHASELMYGWTSDEAVGKTLDQLIHTPEETVEFLKALEQVAGTGITIGPAEYEFRRRDGTKGLCIATIFSIPADEGGLCFVCMDVDITESKKAAEKLVENEKNLQYVLSSTADNFYVIDREYTVVLINKVAERNLEIAWGKLIKPGTNLLDVIPVSGDEPIKENFEKAFAGERFEYEMQHSNPNLPAWILIRFTPVVNESGKIIGVSVVAKDISESKKAEVLIRESEIKYRTIIEQAADGIFLADEEANIIEVNSAGCQMLGYSKEELLKIKYTSLIPPEDLFYNPVLTGKLKRDDQVTNERRLLRKDGSLIEVEISAKVLFDGRYQSIIREITERKKADKALRDSEERYRALVENATEALVVLDVKKRVFVSVSESATKLFRMSREELLKAGPVVISPEYQPDGRLSSEAIMENIQKTIDGEKPAFEWMHCDKDGNPILCEVWLVRLPSENEILIRGTIIDITDRKKVEDKLQQSEQKYRLLFYNNPLPMWMTTIPDLDIIDVNDAAIKQYGYSREEFLKLNTRELRPAEDVAIFLQEVDKMQPDMINIKPWRHKKKDGSVIHVETYSHQILYEGKRVWLGLSHDITEKYLAKELLEKSYADIRQLASNLQSIREDERTNIAREIHDELGQQLTGLKMDLHWLSRKINSTDEEVNDKMKESIELINATIASVRKISTDLRPSILDDLGLIAALEWQSEEFEKRSGTRVEFTNKAGDITVKPAVTTAIFRIYQELLTNIARHANADLATTLLKKENNKLYFRVTDNGSGFNLESISNKKTLGLLGIKERTLLLGGTYEFKSKPGEGSETIISIPLMGE